MLVRGLLHVHTNFSHDGRWTPYEMASFLRGRGYQFVCVTEHSQDMDESKIEQLCEFCAAGSSSDFCLIPGIEYSCSHLLHIAGVGCTLRLDVSDPVQVAHSIRSAGGFAVLAHPRRIGWLCADSLFHAVNATEVWNIRYDGKFLPLPASLEFLESARALNREVLAAIGHDLHSKNGFYAAGIALRVGALDRQAILNALKAGEYTNESSFWNLSARGSLPSHASLERLRIFRGVLDQVRALRNKVELVARRNRNRRGK